MDTLVAVKVRGCNFTYAKGKVTEKILDGVDLTVPSGVIYALLGPSGCGKTTLLKIITGMMNANTYKEISVFGCPPNSKNSVIPGAGVGYMPQELALYEDLTTEETLRLFARLNLVKECVIDERISKLVQVLDLSLKKKLIRNLSGGQQRRVSLATALLHHPPLLILDEPTVGVDPLLRKGIWEYLVNLTATKQTTIIITTHYIEEAKDADMVGAMRMGRVLVEASPSMIMNTFRDYSLESCFYKICYTDTSKYEMNEEKREAMDLLRRGNEDGVKWIPRLLTTKIAKEPYILYKAIHLTKRNFVLRLRNIPALLFEMFVPVVCIAFMCICMGQRLSFVDVALVNDEKTGNYSLDFVKHIDTDIVSYKHYDLAGGIASVVSGENNVVLHIKDNFTDCVHQRLREGLDVTNETIICSSISAHFDYTDPQVFLALYISFIASMQSFFAKVYANLGGTPLMATLPIDFSASIYGNTDNGGGEFIIVSMILVTLHFLSAASTLLFVVNDRKNGMADKLWTSAVSWVEIFISYLAAELVLNLGQMTLILVYFLNIYGVTVQGPLILLIGLSVAQSCSGIGLGFFLSALTPNGNVANGVIVVSFLEFVHFFTNGLLWPLEGMTEPFRTMALYLPLTMSNEAFKSVIYRGWGLENVTVILGFVSPAIWFSIYFGFGFIILKYFK